MASKLQSLVPLVIVLLLLTVAALAEGSLEYGNEEELCGLRSLFVDAGTSKEARDNIISYVKDSKIEVQIAEAVEEADILIILVDSTNQWTEWALTIEGRTPGNLRLVHRIKDGNARLNYFRPSSKMARWFIEAWKKANSAGCVDQNENERENNDADTDG